MNNPLRLKKYGADECSGPRPPIPGEESGTKKMTEDAVRNSPPSYLNWARTLNHLLEDRDGVELFKKYVEEEAPSYNDHLNFYFACEGLKQQTDPEKVKQIIGAIYRFLRKSQLSISDDLRRHIKTGLKNEVPLNPNIYDSMQQHVETLMRDNLYPAFLCSEMYILYIQRMSAVFERFGTGGSCSGSGSSSGASCGSNASETSALSGAHAIQSSNAIKSNYPVTSPASVLYNLNVSHNYSNRNVPFGSSASASSSVYGPSTSASSSGSVSATDTLPRSSTLPTLHEDSELTLNNENDKLVMESGKVSTDLPMRLTRDLLLATQKRRLEIRPPGAHGYVYTANTNTSYVPNSRVDSERASISSGGRTDSDTMSLSNCSLDGRPYIQRRHSSTESKAIRQSAMTNKETNNFQVIPRTQRLNSNEHRPLKESELIALLIPKLEEVKRLQDLEERTRMEHFKDDNLPSNERLEGDRAFAEAIREKFAFDEDNNQDILDQHVSRVWKDQTPSRSPGTLSPCPPLPSRKRITHDIGVPGESSLGVNLMKHSKSMPDHSSSSRKLINKWPSMNTDSGISLVSNETVIKTKESSLRSPLNTTSKLEEARRRLEEETKRSRRYTHYPMGSQQTPASAGSSTLTYQPHLPLLPSKPQDSTTVVFSFCDEEYPYRTKIPCVQPTLKQFKDYLPKKGNFRFFFKTQCDDPDSPVIQEEIVNDSDILPLFEGKVMGLVKPSD